MSIKGISRQLVEEVPYGIYVWVTEKDGQEWVVQDDDANVMNVFCMKGDRQAIKWLADAARYYGFPEGRAVFWSGRRPIDDEELEHQLARQKFGLEPDPLNYPALVAEAKERKVHGG